MTVQKDGLFRKVIGKDLRWPMQSNVFYFMSRRESAGSHLLTEPLVFFSLLSSVVIIMVDSVLEGIISVLPVRITAVLSFTSSGVSLIVYSSLLLPFLR